MSSVSYIHLLFAQLYLTTLSLSGSVSNYIYQSGTCFRTCLVVPLPSPGLQRAGQQGPRDGGLV